MTTTNEVWIEYRRDCRGRNLSPKTLEAYEGAIDCLKRAEDLFLIPEGFQHINWRHMNAFREALLEGRLNPKGPPAPSTAHQVIRSVKTLFKWAVEWEFIEADPMAGLKNVKIPEQQLPVISDEDVMTLLRQLALESDHTACRNTAMILLMLDGGPRVSELVGIALEDVDLERNEALIRQGKGRVDRLIPFSDDCASAIDIYVQRYRAKVDGPLFLSEEGRPLRPLAVNKMLSRLAARTGVKGKVSPVVWRRTFITRLSETQAPIQHIQTLAGHKRIEGTMRYCKDRDVGEAFRTHKRFSPVKALYERAGARQEHDRPAPAAV